MGGALVVAWWWKRLPTVSKIEEEIECRESAGGTDWFDDSLGSWEILII